MIDVNDEVHNFFLGKRLGKGIHRDVFTFPLKEGYVIKIANEPESRAVNLIEARIWNQLTETPAQKWFAPVIDVSESGTYLVQRRAEQLPKEKYPKMIPHFFTDTKYSNFGWIKGIGFVCVDFGSFNMFRGITTKMLKAEWWE